MAFGDDRREDSSRLLSTAILGGGIGFALYKGFKEHPGSIERLVEAVKGTHLPDELPRMMTRAPREIEERVFEEAISAMEDMMSSSGREETLTRIYDRALYKAGVVSDEFREDIVSALKAEGTSTAEEVQSAVKKYERQLGGTRGVYESIREVFGGTKQGFRSKEAAELIRLTSVGGYTRSSFDVGGVFWKDLYERIQPTAIDAPLTRIGVSPIAEALAPAFGETVEPGIRISNRPRWFEHSHATFSFQLPRTGEKIDLPYREYRIGGSRRQWFLTIPEAVEHKGVSYVAADHRGMGFAAVPHFAVQGPGGKIEKISLNKAMGIYLYGDANYGVSTGLVHKLHELKGDEKALRDLTWRHNTYMRGLFRRITGSSTDMTQGLMQSESILPLDRFMQEVFGQVGRPEMQDIKDFFKRVQESGFEAGPLASADPMAKHVRIATKDWAQRWDLFGEGYPMERRFAQRFRDFEMTEDAMRAADLAPIGGILPRGYGITATAAARAETHRAPQLVSYLSLAEAAEMSAEEGVISRRVAGMMETRKTSYKEVRRGTVEAAIGQRLGEGDIIGVDYRTGETILARYSEGRVTQRIVDAKSHGEIVQLKIETRLPAQSQVKTFGLKVQYHEARGPMPKELAGEYGVARGTAGHRYRNIIEMAGPAGALKNVPQEINKQMAEALWLTTYRRLDQANLIRSGGRSKILRQMKRARSGERTYTWKQGMAREKINMGMWAYVRDQQSRETLLKRMVGAGARTSKRLAMEGEQSALGVGLEILKKAKKWNMDEIDLSLIGGAYYKVLADAVGEDSAKAMLKSAGLTEGDISAVASAKGVLAMPTMHVGGYASFDHRWGKGSIEYRNLQEIKAQKWGEAGELFIGELARRVEPAQDMAEIERAALSIVGRTEDLPEGLEKITGLREAKVAMGEREFLFEYGGRQIYVPSPKVRGMGTFTMEVGNQGDQELRKAYSQYFDAISDIRDFPGEKSEGALKGATEHLEQLVHKEWLASQSASGKVVGSVAPVARRWTAGIPGGAGYAHQYQSMAEIIADQDRLFTIGLSREAGETMFRDLLSVANEEERAFLLEQRKAFGAGEKVTAGFWRAPASRPQSMLPAWVKMVEGDDITTFHPKLEYLQQVSGKSRVLDVSMAHGMALDFDMDHTNVAIIADQKTKIALDKLMNSERWRTDFVEGIAIQKDIFDRIKDAAASGAIGKETEQYAIGIQRLTAAAVETGPISNLVGDMRAAAAFQAATNTDYWVASHLFAAMEEGPISGKHGLHVGEVKDLLSRFVKGEGEGIRAAMTEAWHKLFKDGTFQAGKIKYSEEEFATKVGGWISAAEDSRQLQAWRSIARRGSKARKGEVDLTQLTVTQLSRALKDVEGGLGDVNSALIREMRMGPGSGLSRSRATAAALSGVKNTALSAFKKHWKYPAAAVGVAAAVSALFSGTDLDMPRDHGDVATNLGAGPGVPHISTPTGIQSRIVTTGGGAMPAGYGAHLSGNYGGRDLSALSQFGREMGSTVTLRDNRGAITPEYIRKAQSERYV